MKLIQHYQKVALLNTYENAIFYFQSPHSNYHYKKLMVKTLKSGT
ncbi:hypothetical protein FDUTEX481_09478 [Tolypothrix sp. PCC 7601]|nr:hypothetical protein FDUTEX481_09478 [Tolypothrix sp. PCC 7601]